MSLPGKATENPLSLKSKAEKELAELLNIKKDLDKITKEDIDRALKIELAKQEDKERNAMLAKAAKNLNQYLAEDRAELLLKESKRIEITAKAEDIPKIREIYDDYVKGLKDSDEYKNLTPEQQKNFAKQYEPEQITLPDGREAMIFRFKNEDDKQAFMEKLKQNNISFEVKQPTALRPEEEKKSEKKLEEEETAEEKRGLDRRPSRP